MSLPILKTGAELHAYLKPHRSGKIALVPTMGALHEGHLSLVRRAREIADHVVVYIFVNPAQFAPHEDLATYPRPIEADIKALTDLGYDNLSLFMPDASEIYPVPSRTQFVLGEIDSRWESTARPHFFAGVSLVLNKFFHIVRPDIAIFGEKDFQQLQVVRQFVRDLSFPIEIIGGEILREPSGLAMSSRNVYLTDEQRNIIAPKIFAALTAAAADIRAGVDVQTTTAKYTQQLLDAGFNTVDYFAYVDNETLMPLSRLMPHASRLITVARLGNTRLLDNIAVT